MKAQQAGSSDLIPSKEQSLFPYLNYKKVQNRTKIAKSKQPKTKLWFTKKLFFLTPWEQKQCLSRPTCTTVIGKQKPHKATLKGKQKWLYWPNLCTSHYLTTSFKSTVLLHETLTMLQHTFVEPKLPKTQKNTKKETKDHKFWLFVMKCTLLQATEVNVQ